MNESRAAENSPYSRQLPSLSELALSQPQDDCLSFEVSKKGFPNQIQRPLDVCM